MQEPETVLGFLMVCTCGCVAADASEALQQRGRSGEQTDDVMSAGPRTGVITPSTTGGAAAPTRGQGSRIDRAIQRMDAAVDPECDPLPVSIRDFSETHPDFELEGGDDVLEGIVQERIGVDRKPIYAPLGETAYTSNARNFEQWYRDTPGVNMRFDIYLPVYEDRAGDFVYDSTDFFPIDGLGLGNEGNPHNYHFTTEIHTTFSYGGGERFRFAGDDDLWIFVNDRLALDLGGIHQRTTGIIDFDELAETLDLVPGNTYPMDIFHAERHVTASNFRIETNIPCFVAQ